MKICIYIALEALKENLKRSRDIDIKDKEVSARRNVRQAANFDVSTEKNAGAGGAVASTKIGGLDVASTKIIGDVDTPIKPANVAVLDKIESAVASIEIAGAVSSKVPGPDVVASTKIDGTGVWAASEKCGGYGTIWGKFIPKDLYRVITLWYIYSVLKNNYDGQTLFTGPVLGFTLLLAAATFTLRNKVSICLDQLNSGGRTRSGSGRYLLPIFLLLSSGMEVAEGLIKVPNMLDTTTTVEHVGRERTPVVVLNNVLPKRAYISLRDDLRSRTDFIEGHGNNVNFPGKIATLDRAIVDPLLDALLGSKKMTDIYPRATFEQREHVRGFASILCNHGWVHNDHMGSRHKEIVAPAAVFYFGFDGVAGTPTKTGTAFYREKESGLERMTSIGDNETEFCAVYPRSLGCSHRVNDGSKTSSISDASPFEETYRVVGEPNRLVLYPQDVLHNAWVENSFGDQMKIETETEATPNLPCSPQEGRLAISLFFLSQAGREIVDVLDGVWRVEATEKLQGMVQAAATSGGGREVVDMEEARRKLDEWRRLLACVVLVKGETFNVVDGNCSLSTTTTVGDGETLRVRGKDDLNHPELNRGGAANGETTVSDRHFVMTGTSNLTLMNLKLTGAWVGNTDTGCMGCGYCQKTVSKNVKFYSHIFISIPLRISLTKWTNLYINLFCL